MSRVSWWRARVDACDALGVIGAVLALLLLAVPCTAEAPDVSFDRDEGSCRVRGGFLVSAPVAVAWSVLSDYDHIGTYVPSIRESRLERQADGQLLLRQETIATALVFHRRVEVLLALDERPGSRILFHDVLGRDFKSYDGEWRLAAQGDDARVEYVLSAEPRGALARAFCRGAMRNGVRELLEQVRQEILRRARTGSPPRP